MFILRSDCFTSYSHKCLIINHCVLKAASISTYIVVDWLVVVNRPPVYLFVHFYCIYLPFNNWGEYPIFNARKSTQTRRRKTTLSLYPETKKTKLYRQSFLSPTPPPPSNSYSDFIKINLLSINPNKNEECDEREHV